MDTKRSIINSNTPVMMTGIVLVAIFVLLTMNAVQFLLPPSEGRLSLREIRGMAVEYNRTPYTLNLEQQMEVAAIVNAATPTSFKHTVGENSPKSVQTIYVYQFNDRPTIEIVPIGYVNNNLVFTVPDWNLKDELVESSNGKLKELLSHSYDS